MKVNVKIVDIVYSKEYYMDKFVDKESRCYKLSSELGQSVSLVKGITLKRTLEKFG